MAARRGVCCGSAARRGCRGGDGAALATWDIKDVEFATCRRLSGEIFGRIVADVVTVDDVVVPVAGAELESVGTLEAEGTFPGSGLGVAVFDYGKRKLALVVVP